MKNIKAEEPWPIGAKPSPSHRIKEPASLAHFEFPVKNEKECEVLASTTVTSAP
jgi:hypothetical protein